jgi:hypothetical protein
VKVAGAAGSVARIFHPGPPSMPNLLRTSWACILLALFIFAVAWTPCACTQAPNIHDTPEVRKQACINCHAQAFASATNPTHVGALPQTCNLCHSTRGWIPAAASASGANHPWFPLVHKHANVMCETCHTKGYQMGDTPKDCVGCHQMNYDTANNPPHVGLPTTCATCHNDLGWMPSTFAHPWPLDGKHATTPCASCHTGTPPRYPGTPTACAGCHLADFQGSTFPGHNAFPQTCADCHSTTTWQGASAGAHPEANFPVTTGSHSNPGIVCSDCHIAALGSPVAGKNTDCVHCHLGAHMQPAIDARHVALKVMNYPGQNAAQPNFCLGCHPKG